MICIIDFFSCNLKFRNLLCKIAVRILIWQILRVISQPRHRPLCTRHTVIWSKIPWFHLSTILFHELISSVGNRLRPHFVFVDIGFDCFHGYYFHRHNHKNWHLRGSEDWKYVRLVESLQVLFFVDWVENRSVLVLKCFWCIFSWPIFKSLLANSLAICKKERRPSTTCYIVLL